MGMNRKWSQENYIRALRFACAAHAGQTLPGSALPYAVHLACVAMEVTAALAVEPVESPDLAVQCALLHDTIEDTAQTAATLESAFGPAVAAGVLALSKTTGLSKAEAMRQSLERIRLQPREIWMVKLADRITNLQKPPESWSPPKIVAYHAQAVEILDALGEASPFLAARLTEKIKAYALFHG
ncbi:MAG: HD domain-containing protein [Rhodospirillales bacterium]|nr:HD domain-containing protein [Rhodospirillales bacterium]